MRDPSDSSRQTSTRGDEPFTHAPTAILILAAALVAAHAFRALGLGLYEPWDLELLRATAFVPARFSLWMGLVSEPDIAADVAAAPPELRRLRAFLFATFVRDAGPAPWTLATHALLHGGWEHVVFNALWLLVFGTPVLHRFGAARFLLFFAAATAAGAVLHALVNPTDVAILVGASGGVSGLTAAAVRFAFAEGPFRFGSDPERFRQPAPPLAAAFANRTVLAFVAIWFGLNLLAGLGFPLAMGSDARIAWEAHVGGFLAGLALFPLFDPVRP